MDQQRDLIVNADDFGLSPGVNEGIVAAHERGIVTSASLMVRWPAAVEAVRIAREYPRLSLGLHVDLGEWECRDGVWEAVYEVVRMDDPQAVAEEVARQLDTFRRLVGRDPSHLDSHQNVHRKHPVLPVAAELARKLAVPLRYFCPPIVHRTEFYGRTRPGGALPEGLGLDRLIGILRSLGPGVSELTCHPGLQGDVASIYNAERADEVRLLCDPRVRQELESERIRLLNFDEWRRLGGTVSAGT